MVYRVTIQKQRYAQAEETETSIEERAAEIFCTACEEKCFFVLLELNEDSDFHCMQVRFYGENGTEDYAEEYRYALTCARNRQQRLSKGKEYDAVIAKISSLKAQIQKNYAVEYRDWQNYDDEQSFGAVSAYEDVLSKIEALFGDLKDECDCKKG